MDFSIKNNTKPVKVDLKSMTMAETADLTSAQRSEWRKIHGYAQQGKEVMFLLN